MGIDLTLCPHKYHPSPWDWHLAYDRISVERDYSIFGQIEKGMGRDEGVKEVCKPKPLPPDVRFSWYEDEGIKDRKTDPYGSKLTYVTAGELGKVKTDKAHSYTKAVFAMVRAMPPETPIVLWWH